MKYCKSKRGYFYKVVGDKKTRISMEEYKAGCKKRAMKGGFDRFGKIQQSDFELKKNKNTEPHENQISIIQNTKGIPHVFFGYDKSIGKYRYVMYYFDTLSNNPRAIPPVFFFNKLEDDGRISEPHLLINNKDLDEFHISAPILLHLYYEFFHHYNTGNKSEEIKIIYDYLKKHVFKRLMRVDFEGNDKEMLDKIVQNRVTNLPEFVEMKKL
jgi:hypothetical protein